MSRERISEGDGMPPPSDAADAGDGEDVGVFYVVRMGREWASCSCSDERVFW